MEEDKLQFTMCRILDNYRELCIKYHKKIEDIKRDFKAGMDAKEQVLLLETRYEKKKAISIETENEEIIQEKNHKIEKLEKKCKELEEKLCEMNELAEGVYYLEGEMDILKEENQKLIDEIEKYKKTYEDLLRSD
jgi:hypothetical protein